MGAFLFIILLLFVVFYSLRDSKKDEKKENSVDEAESKLGIDKGYDIGYLVCFGRDDDGKRAEWMVLDVDGTNLFLLRNEPLPNTIGDSSYNKIRLYLNDTSSKGFLGKYFTENEQNLIIPQEITCEDETLTSSFGLEFNSDKVFLLDVHDYEKHILRNSSKCCWLLRNPSLTRHGRLSYVAPDGLVDSLDLSSYNLPISLGPNSNGYLRPAMWVKMRASSENEYPVSMLDAMREDFRASYVDKRAVLTFGKNALGEDVEWIILANRPGVRLIISKLVLFKTFYDTDRASITSSSYDIDYAATLWGISHLRKLLNDAFLNEEQEEYLYRRKPKFKYGVKFSGEEKAKILEVCNEHHENPLFFTEGGQATKDKVFLLSIKEVNQYFPTDPERKAFDTNGEKSDWCTRSPGCHPATVTFISESGHINYYGARCSAILGVRPAMWIKVE